MAQGCFERQHELWPEISGYGYMGIDPSKIYLHRSLRARALCVLFVDTAVRVQQTTIIASKARRCSTAAFLSI